MVIGIRPPPKRIVVLDAPSTPARVAGALAALAVTRGGRAAPRIHHIRYSVPAQMCPGASGFITNGQHVGQSRALVPAGSGGGARPELPDSSLGEEVSLPSRCRHRRGRLWGRILNSHHRRTRFPRWCRQRRRRRLGLATLRKGCQAATQGKQETRFHVPLSTGSIPWTPCHRSRPALIPAMPYATRLLGTLSSIGKIGPFYDGPGPVILEVRAADLWYKRQTLTLEVGGS